MPSQDKDDETNEGEGPNEREGPKTSTDGNGTKVLPTTKSGQASST
jgi:hypothetical protein